jgi:hypothetical protein
MGFRLGMRRDNRAAVKKTTRQAATESLEDAANELLRVANETVPYREGVLEGSGEVHVNARSSTGQFVATSEITASVTYGGEADAYAVKQHEDMTLSHPGKGRAKWLELAAKENAKRLGVAIGVGIKERM